MRITRIKSILVKDDLINVIQFCIGTTTNGIGAVLQPITQLSNLELNVAAR